MDAVFSIVYGQAALFAALLALAYAALAVQGWLKHKAQRPTQHHAQANIGAVGNAITPAHSSLLPSYALLAVVAAHTLLLMATLSAPHTLGQPPITPVLGQNWGANLHLNLSFAQALSLATCVGVWLFIIESYWLKRSGLGGAGGIDSLRPLALGFPAVAVGLAAWVAPAPVVLSQGAALHVLVAIAAHGVALLTCGHGVLLLALSRVLKQDTQSGWAHALAQHCPPLVVLERLLIRLSLWVAALLAGTVALGLWGGVLKFDHKTVLTIGSLLAWLAVSWGYQRRGWRGAMLLSAVLLATGLLLLAYIGSRFVLHAVLQR